MHDRQRDAAGGDDAAADLMLTVVAGVTKRKLVTVSKGLSLCSEEDKQMALTAPDDIAALRQDDVSALHNISAMQELKRMVAACPQPEARRVAAYWHLSYYVPTGRWSIYWHGYEDWYYNVIVPGDPFDYSGPEWDEPADPDPDRIAAAIDSIIRQRPGISPAVARLAALSTAGVC